MPIESSKTSTATWRRWVKGQIAALSGGGGGQWVLIEDYTPTAVTSYDFTWDETLYSSVRLELEAIQPDSDAGLLLRLGHTDGATILNTTGDYLWSHREIGSATAFTVSGVTDEIELQPGGLTVDASFTQGCGGKIEVIGGSDANTTAIVEASTHFVYGGAGGTFYSYYVQGYVKNYGRGSEAFDTLQIAWDGAMPPSFKAQGSIRLYGLKNS